MHGFFTLFVASAAEQAHAWRTSLEREEELLFIARRPGVGEPVQLCTFELNQDHTEKNLYAGAAGLDTQHLGIMVLPVEVADAAMRCEQKENLARVQAWLDITF